jgi:hypothetical protein
MDPNSEGWECLVSRGLLTGVVMLFFKIVRRVALFDRDRGSGAPVRFRSVCALQRDTLIHKG